MNLNQYGELITKSEELLQEMTDILQPLPPPLPRDSILQIQKKKKKRRIIRRFVLLIFLTLLLLLLALVGGRLLHMIGQYVPLRYEEVIHSAPRKILSDELKSEEENSVNDTFASARVSLKIKRQSKSKVGSLIVESLPSNSVGLRFSVFKEGTERALFRSQLIAPGYGVYEIPLTDGSIKDNQRGKILLTFYENEEEIEKSSVNIRFIIRE
jgi:hypothetical protein